MKNWRLLGGAAALAIAVVLSAVPVVAADGSLTVGDFVKQIARVKQLDAKDAVTARASIEATGVRLPEIRLDKRLTQGDVAQISTAVGIPVTTSTPAAEFTPDQLDRFMSNFGPELGAPQASTDGTNNGADPRTKGKGKKKGLFKRSPSEPI